MSANAATISVTGKSPVGELNGLPVYLINESSISLSSSSGSFNYVYVDDNQVAYNSGSYWTSYSLNVSLYRDGALHVLEIKRYSSDYGRCYIGNADAIAESFPELLHGGIIYSISGNVAAVAGAIPEIEDAEILPVYSKDGVDYPVSSIGVNAFAGCSSLRSVSIPLSVTSIEASAFRNCTSLTSVVIPEGVTAIMGLAFDGCDSLTSLTFNAINCTNCYSTAFPASISSLTLGNKVTTIPANFLYNGSKIESVTIPNTVTTIGNYAFLDSDSIKSLTLGSRLTTIGTNAFAHKNGSAYQKRQIAKVFWLSYAPPTNYSAVSANVNYVATDQYNLTNQKVYQFLSAKFEVEGTIYVPVSSADRTCDAIDCNYSLQPSAVSISDKVVNRGVELKVLNVNEYAYYNNRNITGLTLANNGNVGDYAFSGCTALTSVVADNSGSIGNSAFRNDGALSAATIGRSVTALGDYAFGSCPALPALTLPDNVATIGQHAFDGCSALASVAIGAGVAEIPQYAFANCAALDNVTIPHNVKTIGDYAFSGCSSLSNLTIAESPEDSGAPYTPEVVTFDNWTSTNHNDGSTSYKQYTLSVSGGDVLSFDYSVSSEANYDFLIVKINNEEVLKESGSKTGNYTHTFDAEAIVTLYVAYTKDSSSSSGSDLASVYNITQTSTEIFGDILRLGSNGASPLFADCPLRSAYLGRKLVYATTSGKGYSPFYGNTSLRNVEISDAETQITGNEFYGCSALERVTIGNGVRRIGSNAFWGCSALDYFSVGYNIGVIGEKAFFDCTGLTGFYSNAAVPPVCGNQALYEINKWECTLYIPAESIAAYMAADQWCDFFLISECDAVAVESIRINVDSLDGVTGETFQLEAEVLPVNATRKNVEWVSSNPDIVTVDENGLAEFINGGCARIVARALDGSGVEAAIDVTVTVKEPVLGDSNANGSVTIADAVNTANYVVGKEVKYFCEAAADVNQDGRITLSDASATVMLVLDQPAEASSAFKVRSFTARTDADMLIVDDFDVKAGETASVSVALDNTLDYVALQADVTVPQGMILEAVNAGRRAEATHTILTKRIDDRTVRVALFDVNNSEFADGDDAILELIVKACGAACGGIELGNIVAADADAAEHMLSATGGNNSREESGIDGVATGDIRIASANGVIRILNAQGREVSVHTLDGTTIARFVAETDAASCKAAPGMYIVSAGNKTVKIIVK